MWLVVFFTLAIIVFCVDFTVLCKDTTACSNIICFHFTGHIIQIHVQFSSNIVSGGHREGSFFQRNTEIE